MIEALKDFPDNVIAIACHGRVTKADYETVLIPGIEDKLSRHKKVRIYCEIPIFQVIGVLEKVEQRITSVGGADVV